MASSCCSQALGTLMIMLTLALHFITQQPVFVRASRNDAARSNITRTIASRGDLQKSRPTPPFLGWRKAAEDRNGVSGRGLRNRDAANLGKPSPEWRHVVLPSRSGGGSSGSNDHEVRHTFSISPPRGSRDFHNSNDNDNDDTTSTTRSNINHACRQEGVPKQPGKMSAITEIREGALSNVADPTLPFLGWRKPTKNRNGMSSRGLGYKCAANLGQPRPEWGQLALPSRTRRSSNVHNVRQTFSILPTEGSDKYRNKQGSSGTATNSSPVLISTPGGIRESFAPAIDMTGNRVGGTIGGKDTVKGVNADVAPSVDWPQHPIFEAFDANYNEGVFEYDVIEDRGASMRVGDTLGPGEVLTSQEGDVELLVDEMGSIVMKQTLQTDGWMGAGEESRDVTIDLFRSSFPGKPIRKLQGVLERLQRLGEGKSQQQPKIISCGAGITCRRLPSKPRGKMEKSSSTSSEVFLRVTNHGELEITKGRKRMIIEPAPPAKKKGWRRSFPVRALQVFRPESDDYELRVVETGFEVWLGTVRVWGFETFPWEGAES